MVFMLWEEDGQGVPLSIKERCHGALCCTGV